MFHTLSELQLQNLAQTPTLGGMTVNRSREYKNITREMGQSPRGSFLSAATTSALKIGKLCTIRFENHSTDTLTLMSFSRKLGGLARIDPYTDRT